MLEVIRNIFWIIYRVYFIDIPTVGSTRLMGKTKEKSKNQLRWRKTRQ